MGSAIPTFGVWRNHGGDCLRVTRDGIIVPAEPRYQRAMARAERQVAEEQGINLGTQQPPPAAQSNAEIRQQGNSKGEIH